MALVLKDRVQETTTTTGTGTITLAGAVSGYQSFSAIGSAQTTYYCVTSGTEWEVGVGTYTSAGTTLSRDTIYASSAGGAAITLAGTSTVFCVYPADKAVYEDAAGAVSVPSNLTVVGSLWLGSAGTEKFDITSASAGATVTARILNSGATAGSVARFQTQCGGPLQAILASDITANAGIAGTVTAHDFKLYSNNTLRATFSSAGLATFASPLVLPAGTATASTAPLKLTTGTNLTTAEAGAVEYDGSTFFATEDTTSGRGFIPAQKFYRQIANGTTTTAGAIADFFPATSSISLSASSYYEIECWCYFLKTTAGTVTFTMAASSAPTWMNGNYIANGITGINVAAAVTTGWAGSAAAVTAAWAASGSLSTGVNHGFKFTIRILTNAATNWRMRYTSNTGTTQSLIGSYYRVCELPAASTGVFVA